MSLSFSDPAGFGGGYLRAASFSDGMPVVIAESLVPDFGSGPDAGVERLVEDLEATD